jgi:hypothetical protein
MIDSQCNDASNSLPNAVATVMSHDVVLTMILQTSLLGAKF